MGQIKNDRDRQRLTLDRREAKRVLLQLCVCKSKREVFVRLDQKHIPMAISALGRRTDHSDKKRLDGTLPWAIRINLA